MGRLILVRHGETQMNADGIYFGILDPDMNDKGVEQLKTTKRYLMDNGYKYDNIYSSDLIRASHSAKIVNFLNKEIAYDETLRELNFGIFEGLSYEQIEEKYPKEYEKSEQFWESYNYETGESVLDLYNRVQKFLSKINLEKDNMIVTHWGVINCILCSYFSVKIEEYWRYSLDNGKICIIDMRNNNFPVLKGFNLG